MKTVLNTSVSFHKKQLSQNKYMYLLKIAGTDQASFGPVPVLMAIKIILSTDLGCSATLLLHTKRFFMRYSQRPKVNPQN